MLPIRSISVFGGSGGLPDQTQGSWGIAARGNQSILL